MTDLPPAIPTEEPRLELALQLLSGQRNNTVIADLFRFVKSSDASQSVGMLFLKLKETKEAIQTFGYESPATTARVGQLELWLTAVEALKTPGADLTALDGIVAQITNEEDAFERLLNEMATYLDHVGAGQRDAQTKLTTGLSRADEDLEIAQTQRVLGSLVRAHGRMALGRKGTNAIEGARIDGDQEAKAIDRGADVVARYAFEGENTGDAAGSMPARLPELVGLQLSEEAELVDGVVRNDRLIRRWIIPGFTVVSQAVSATMATVGWSGAFGAAGTNNVLVGYALGAIPAFVANGTLLTLSLGLEKGAWKFGIGRNANKAATALFVTALGISAGGAIAGVAELAVPGMVVQDNWAMNDRAGTSFSEAAQKLAADKAGERDRGNKPAEDKAKSLLAAVDSQGRALVNEAVGHGGTGNAGYDKESVREMNRFNERYTAAVQEIMALRQCSTLEAIQAAYVRVYAELEEARNAGVINAAPFNPSGGMIQSQIDECNTVATGYKGPIEDLQADLKRIEEKLEEARGKVMREEIHDTYDLNAYVMELNPLIQRVAEQLGIEPVKLDRLDPIGQAGFHLAVTNMGNVLYNLAIAGPKMAGRELEYKEVSSLLAILSVIMVLLDGMALYLAPILESNRKHVQKTIRESIERLKSPSVYVGEGGDKVLEKVIADMEKLASGKK